MSRDPFPSSEELNRLRIEHGARLAFGYEPDDLKRRIDRPKALTATIVTLVIFGLMILAVTTVGGA